MTAPEHVYTQEQARYLVAAAITIAKAARSVEEALRLLARGAREDAESHRRERHTDNARAAFEAAKMFASLADVLSGALKEAQIEVA